MALESTPSTTASVSTPGSDQAAVAPPAVPAPNPEASPYEGLPGDFLGADGLPKIDSLVNGYRELAKARDEYTAKIAGRPESPDKYEVKLPEGFQAPEGIKFEFRADDPLMVQARKLAHDAGLGQSGFSELLGAYAQFEISRRAEADAQRQAEVDAEFKKLGHAGAERIRAVTTALNGIMSPNEAAAVVVTSADGLRGLEKLIGRLSGPAMAAGGGAPAKVETLDDIQKEMSSNWDRYRNDKIYAASFASRLQAASHTLRQ